MKGLDQVLFELSWRFMIAGLTFVLPNE